MKYYIDEPDLLGSTHPETVLPLIGVRGDTQFYDTKEEAEAEAEKLVEKSDICFCVFEFDESKKL